MNIFGRMWMVRQKILICHIFLGMMLRPGRISGHPATQESRRADPAAVSDPWLVESFFPKNIVIDNIYYMGINFLI